MSPILVLVYGNSGLYDIPPPPVLTIATNPQPSFSSDTIMKQMADIRESSEDSWAIPIDPTLEMTTAPFYDIGEVAAAAD